jgi:beta-glucanase (GH16 family)
MSNRLQLADPASNDYHVYAIDWTPTKIEWYCDGVLYNRLSIVSAFDGRYPFACPFYLILMMQIGGGWPPAPNPAEYPDTMLTDWVRVWQLPGTDGGIGP